MTAVACGGRGGPRLSLIALLAGAALAPPAEPQAPVRVQTIGGERWQGALAGLDPEGRVHVVTEAGDRSAPLEEVRAIVNDAAVPTEPPPAGLVVCWSGQTLRANVRAARTGPGGAALALEVAPARSLVEMPVRSIRALRFTDQPRGDGQGFDDALRERAARDLLFAYRRGDPSAGLVRLTVRVLRFEALGDEVAVVVEFDGKEQPAQPLGKLYGLVLGQGAAPDPQSGARTTVHFAGGFQGVGQPAAASASDRGIVGRLVALDPSADRCVLRLDEGGELDLPWQLVARLAVRSDRLVYLSDLDPVEVEQTPALSRKWEWLKDRAPGGPGIELGGKVHERGLVLVPRTRLTFDLGGRFDWFEATVGIDDRAGDVGSAVMRVLGDGNELFAARGVGRGTAPQTVRVAVTGMQRLTLEADFGELLDLGDHCAFADARLRRDS